ncbi:DUF1579 domain-containing protein [Chitinophaga sp. HK235]|uniref:DUF1579 domain-containing protein n=1 Tax=Chitinophaga sp. HK235 TaxID=2952571 RepID=UPI001BAC8C95|nr:DUF1579 domain-containing protein [Chitinophaga sp. HK235]
MKTIHVLAVAAWCLLAVTTTSAQKIDTAAIHRAWMTYMTPGPEHDRLAKMNGDWACEITMWKGPGAPPEKTTGTCRNTMVMGGRYQEGRVTSQMEGKPFEGLSTTAYDNSRRMFLNTWIDNMGTGIMMLEGKWDPTISGIVYTGKCHDPISHKMIDLRQVYKFQDDNNYTLEAYRVMNGKEVKDMEVKFKRQ